MCGQQYWVTLVGFLIRVNRAWTLSKTIPEQTEEYGCLTLCAVVL